MTSPATTRAQKEFHAQGTLLMGGTFLDLTAEALTTMGILTTCEAVEEHVRGDPFVTFTWQNSMSYFFDFMHYENVTRSTG